MSQIFSFSMSLQVIWTPAQQVSFADHIFLQSWRDLFSLVAIMDLILNINRVGPQGEGEHSATTCMMVTHNPEIECYADRILYVQDGQFVKQALNEVQTAIKEEEYTHFLHADDDDWANQSPWADTSNLILGKAVWRVNKMHWTMPLSNQNIHFV